VKYTEHDVSRDRAAAEEMVRMTGQMGVPVIVIDGEAIIGFDRGRIQTLLAGANKVKPVRFGLKITDAGKQGAASIPGALIGAVIPGFLGEKAGLKVKDIITEINTRRINGAAEMEQALKGLKPGNIVAIMFRRGNDTRKSEIVV
jgi:S1-C subfamily serine protease